MKLFADECVYAITTKTLREWGHDVETAQEAGLSGHDDNELLQYSTSRNRILISISRQLFGGGDTSLVGDRGQNEVSTPQIIF